MPFQVGDNVVIVKENLNMPVPDNYEKHLHDVFTITKITNSGGYPYECSIEGEDAKFAFKKEEIKLVSNELIKIKRESKEF